MILRYQYYNSTILGFIAHKSNYFIYKNIVLNKIIINAGAYKPSALFLQHVLLLTTLTARPANLAYQLHGKRQKRTVSINTKLINRYIWSFLDKFIQQFIPAITDFKTIKFKKSTQYVNNYTLRIRQKLGIFIEFDNLVEANMYDTFRGVYLPLTIHFKFNTQYPQIWNENYLRMLKLPLNLYKFKFRPAFDDAVTF